MSFHLVDVEHWNRKSHYEHYLHRVPCSYSMTVPIQVQGLREVCRQRQVSFYAGIIFLLTRQVNQHPEFRMGLDAEGRLGQWDQMRPSFTVFHPETETFSSLWTEYSPHFSDFYRDFCQVREAYSQSTLLAPQQEQPENQIPISMIPWVSMSGFTLELPESRGYFTPIFTLGKWYQDGEKLMMPLTIQVHHGVCDGFHASRLINECEQIACDVYRCQALLEE